MGGQLLVILPQSWVLGPYGERFHRRTVEPGHGTQVGITMVNELTRGGREDHAQGGRKRERLGLAVHANLRCAGIPFST